MKSLEEAIRILQTHRPELEELGVVHCGIFGSVAGRQNGPESDTDVLVQYDGQRVRSLLDVAAIRNRLEKILGGPVDVADRDRLKEHVAPSALNDVVHAF